MAVNIGCKMNYNLENIVEKLYRIEEIYEFPLILEGIYDVYEDIYQFELFLRCRYYYEIYNRTGHEKGVYIWNALMSKFTIVCDSYRCEIYENEI